MEAPQLRILSQNDIAVVIPAYNEELTIGTIVLRTRNYASDVIVVDDGSSDRTSEVAKAAGAKVIRLTQNRGKSYAVFRGFAEVKDRHYSAAVMIDADGQHDPSEIHKLIEPIIDGKADLVIGSRLMENGHQIPRYRKFGQKMLNRITNVGAKQKVTDSQSGFRALSMKGVRNMNFKSDGYGLESGMIIHFAEKGLIIKEVPIGVRYDVPRKHKKDPITMGIGLVNQIITMISLRRPLMFLTMPGFFFSFAAILLALASIMQYYIFGWSWMFESLLSGFLLILGSVMMISGLTLNSIAHVIGSQKNIDTEEVEAEVIE